MDLQDNKIFILSNRLRVNERVMFFFFHSSHFKYLFASNFISCCFSILIPLIYGSRASGQGFSLCFVLEPLSKYINWNHPKQKVLIDNHKAPKMITNRLTLVKRTSDFSCGLSLWLGNLPVIALSMFTISSHASAVAISMKYFVA